MRPNRFALVASLCAGLAAAAPASAQAKGKQQSPAAAPKTDRQQSPQQQPPGPPHRMGRDMMGPGHGGPSAEVQKVIHEQYYPPEMVRAFADDLKLTDEQVEKLRKATADVRAEVDQLEWDVSRENSKLAKLLREGASKEQVYAQMDVVFSFENKIKKKMLGMLIVVRDVLSTQQRARLDELRAGWRENQPGPGMGGPHEGCPMFKQHRGRPDGFPPGPPPDGYTPGPSPDSK